MRRLTLITVASAATAVVLPATAASANPPHQSGPGGTSAFGIVANGPIRLGPLPATDGGHTSLLSIPANPVLRAGVLDVTATLAHARSSVADLDVVKALLKASVITATCDNGQGKAALVDAVVAGHRLAVAPPPNTTIPVTISGVGAITAILNKQVRTGDRLTVTALDLDILGQHLAIASASCRALPQAPAPRAVRDNLAVTG